jgi:hypothetical protein
MSDRRSGASRPIPLSWNVTRAPAKVRRLPGFEQPNASSYVDVTANFEGTITVANAIQERRDLVAGASSWGTLHRVARRVGRQQKALANKIDGRLLWP